ncbi:hypothetical protein FGO68_gene8468 [Halteria grandinella]|uniref:Uncharacterized protein n=1 Tax=Halteria grandinella TaxID=5974 RepID=A0A8J8T8D4_HALGN|nr:hypothetical protein FGO68_gene8468 [Halteria grandinella]
MYWKKQAMKFLSNLKLGKHKKCQIQRGFNTAKWKAISEVNLKLNEAYKRLRKVADARVQEIKNLVKIDLDKYRIFKFKIAKQQCSALNIVTGIQGNIDSQFWRDYETTDRKVMCNHNSSDLLQNAKFNRNVKALLHYFKDGNQSVTTMPHLTSERPSSKIFNYFQTIFINKQCLVVLICSIYSSSSGVCKYYLLLGSSQGRPQFFKIYFLDSRRQEKECEILFDIKILMPLLSQEWITLMKRLNVHRNLDLIYELEINKLNESRNFITLKALPQLSTKSRFDY